MKILVMEDSAKLNDCIRDFLVNKGYDVESAYDGKQGMALCQDTNFDLAVIDIFMPEKDGLEVIMELSRAYPRMKLIAISGVHHPEEDYLSTAKIFGADITIRKPFTMEQLMNDIHYLFDQDTLQ